MTGPASTAISDQDHEISREDIAQTSGQPLPQQPTPQLLAGQAPQGLWDALAAQVTAQGFTLRRGDCGPGVNGLTHYRDRTVTVRADVDDAQAVKTLAHELGHVLMHDPTNPTDLTSGATTGMPPQAGAPPLVAARAKTSAALCRGTVEVEAESLAYLIAASHGLDTGSYTFAYVAGWAANAGQDGAAAPEHVVRSTAGRVLAAARLVLAGSQQAAAADHSTGPPTQAVADVAAAQARAADGARRTAALLESATQTPQHPVPQAATYLASGLSADAAAHPAVPVAAAAPSRETPAEPPDHGQILRREVPAGAAITTPPQTRLLQVHNLATAFYRARLQSDADGARARTLLAERSVEASLAARAGLGYAPAGWTALVDHLRAAGVTDRELLAAGLATTCSRGTLIDRFRDRVIFPVQDASGRTVALLGRAVDATVTDGRGERVPKYLNSPDTALYRKGEVLYGLGPAGAALAAGAVPVLVEGPMDVLAIEQASTSSSGEGAGFVGVAPCGTALAAAHVRLLEDATGGLAERGVVVAFDADDAGRHGAVRAFDLLRQANAWPHALTLPDHQDPADLLQQHGPATLHTALLRSAALPLADLVVDQRIDRHAEQLRWAEGRIAAGRSAAALIATLPAEHVARQVARLSVRLELPAAEVTSLLVEAVSLTSDAHIGGPDSTDPRGQRALPAGTRGAWPLRAQRPTASPTGAETRSAAQLARIAFPLPLQEHLQAPHRLPTPSTPPTVAARTGHSAPQRRV